ncbi:MAG: alpha/beta fold hydrolase [Planctomycetaceae bacterium]
MNRGFWFARLFPAVFVAVAFMMVYPTVGARVLQGDATAQVPQSQSAIRHNDLSQFVNDDGQVQRIASKGDWAVRREQILAGMQEAMGPLPSTENAAPFDIVVVEDKRIDNLRRIELTIQMESGDRLPLDLWLPATLADKADPANILALNAQEKLPAMLALHPTGAAGKRIVAGEGPRGNRQYGLELARRGYITICPDYPSFGDYSDYDFETDPYVSGTMKGIVNHRRCVDLLCQMACVDPDRIGVIGHSLGGHNAMFSGVFDERLKIIVSSCGWTPFHDYYGGKIQGWTSDRYMPLLNSRYQLNPDLVPFDFYEVVAALAPRTFVSISPLHDANFDVAGVRKAIPEAAKIYSLLDAKGELILATPDCEHDFPAEMREKAYSEIDRVLRHTPPADLMPDYSGELPRIAAVPAEEAIQTFQTAPGFEIQMIAQEPDVVDPVAVAFDEHGRLFVIEMRDYSEQADEHLGRVRLLIDSDQDGVFDESHIFAEGLSWPTAITCFDGGVFVGSPPEVFYLKDTNGDHSADEKTLVFTGFGRSNVQGLMNCLHWGPDNRIYGQTSSSGATVTCPVHPERPALQLRSRDFSFDPKTFDIRPESGGAQHGMCFDDWGNRFVCSNSDHAQAILYNDRYLTRNSQVAAAPPRVSIAVDGGQAPVFRTSPVEPWRIVRTRLRASGVVKGVVEGGGRPAGYFTGSTGINVYRGDAWPREMVGMLVMADVGSNIVHRKKATADGVTWKAERIDPGFEFISSTDIWFRPVQSANAPDGCLMILDMYRETIEHPASLPPEIKKHLDLTSGRDRGRLYRLAPAGWKFQARDLPGKCSTEQLVAMLAHPNGWHRDTAARLLYERQDESAIEPLRKLAANPESARGRVHALNTLAGLNAQKADDIVAALKDKHARVRETAARHAESFAASQDVGLALSQLANDDDARVRLQAAFSLGAFDDTLRFAPLLTILKSAPADRWIRTAVLTSLQEDCLKALSVLASNEPPSFAQSTDGAAVITELTELVARQTAGKQRKALAALIERQADHPSLQLELVKRTYRGDSGARKDPVFSALTSSIVAAAQKTADDETAASAARIAAIRALTLANYADQSERLLAMLNPLTAPEIQLAALETLGVYGDARAASELIDRVSELSPKVLERTRELMLDRADWAIILLQAMADDRVRSNFLSSAELQRLAGHPDQTLRAAATVQLKAMGTSSREDVIRKYQTTLSLVGNNQRGAEIFKKHCSVCHQLGGVGYQVGPNLATVASRGPESILVNLLDPNREVNPAWREYIAVTTEGRTHNGVIISESATSITLRRAEAKEDSLLRTDLDTLQDTGRSLMPEGLEKEIDPQAAADLISWLMEQK